MSPDPQELGWRLQMSRRMAKLGMEQAAEFLDIPVEHLRDVERGDVCPDTWTVRKMIALYKPSELLGISDSSGDWPPPAGIYLIDDHLIERVLHAATREDLEPLLNTEKPILSFWACTPSSGLRIGTRDEVAGLAATLVMKVQQLAPEYLADFDRFLNPAEIREAVRRKAESGVGGGASVALKPRSTRGRRWIEVLRRSTAAFRFLRRVLPGQEKRAEDAGENTGHEFKARMAPSAGIPLSHGPSVANVRTATPRKTRLRDHRCVKAAAVLVGLTLLYSVTSRTLTTPGKPGTLDYAAAANELIDPEKTLGRRSTAQVTIFQVALDRIRMLKRLGDEDRDLAEETQRHLMDLQRVLETEETLSSESLTLPVGTTVDLALEPGSSVSKRRAWLQAVAAEARHAILLLKTVRTPDEESTFNTSRGMALRGLAAEFDR